MLNKSADLASQDEVLDMNEFVNLSSCGQQLLTVSTRSSYNYLIERICNRSVVGVGTTNYQLSLTDIASNVNFIVE